MITPQQAATKYISGKQKHAAYAITTDIEEHLSFHIDGFKPPYKPDIAKQAQHLMNALGLNDVSNSYFNKLIDQRRPGETEVVQRHRRIIYASITKEPCFKVVSSLNKIVRSDDWKIDYSNSDTIKQEGENLEDYCEKKRQP